MSDTTTTTASSQVLRRLTRREWVGVKAGHLTASGGTLGAVAILVVPKVRVRDDVASEIKSTWMDNSFATNPATVPDIPCQQAFELVMMSGGSLREALQVPLYHGGAIFPRAEDRMKLRLGLDRLLGAEHRRRSQRRHGDDTTKTPGDTLDKASDAYILLGAQEPTQSIDATPLAIALWRLRLWEGIGWTVKGTSQTFADLPEKSFV